MTSTTTMTEQQLQIQRQRRQERLDKIEKRKRQEQRKARIQFAQTHGLTNDDDEQEEIVELKRPFDDENENDARKRAMLEKKHAEENSNFIVYEKMKAFANSLFHMIALKDALTITQSWTIHPLNEEKTTRQNLVLLLELIGFEPFHFTLSTQYMEFFERRNTLRVSNQTLCDETRSLVTNMIRFEEDACAPCTFFVSHGSLSMSMDVYTDFRFDSVLENTLDRRVMMYYFFWTIYRFDKYKNFVKMSAQDLSDFLIVGRFCWGVVELFLCNNSERLSPHIPLADTPLGKRHVQFYHEVESIQKHLTDPARLYDYLMQKMSIILNSF